MLDFSLSYGKQGFRFSLREREVLGFLEPVPTSPLSDLRRAIEKCLDSPIGCPPLCEAFRTRQEVAIIVPDRTRPVKQDVYLPVLLDCLNSSGIPDRDMFVVFANGYHRGQSCAEMEAVVGPEVARRVELVDHNCHDDSSMVFLGETSRNTPVFLNRRVVRADRVVLTGGIVPHYFAGFGGGPKGLNPGVAARETIAANHLLTLKAGAESGLHPNCRDGVLDGNPVYEDIVESARMHPPDFLLNIVQNVQGEIVAGFAGDYLEAHRAGCRFVREKFFLPIKEKAELVLVSCGGHPQDINLIQAHKSIQHGFYALKRGGTLIVLAECPEGIGSPSFLDWFGFDDLPSLRSRLKGGYTINGHTALVTLEKAMASRIILVSSLDDEVVKKMRMTPAGSLQEALTMVDMGKGLTTYIIPNGAVTVPHLSTD